MAGPSTLLYQQGPTAIGTWCARPSDAEFQEGWIDNPTFVFPRTCVEITQEGEDAVIADPSLAMLYRGSQEYSRRAVDPTGDRCEWFEVDPEWIREIVEELDPGVHTNGRAPIKHTHAPADSETYLLQRMLTRHVSSEAEPDPVLVDETLMRIVAQLIHAAYHKDGQQGRRTSRNHKALVNDTKAYLATFHAERLTLADVGRAVGASPFHLARLFKRFTGHTIHNHLTDLRLRAALAELETDINITDVALKVGFASHSHLTKVFHARFGTTPSQFRERSTGYLRKIVIA